MVERLTSLGLARYQFVSVDKSRSGEIGRRTRFRGVRAQARVGSSPTFGTPSLES